MAGARYAEQMRRILAIVLLLPVLPGCVAWEIRDEMRLATYQLEDVRCNLEKVHTQLGDVKSRLDTTNDRLSEVETGLERLDATNASLDTANSALGTVHERLALLRSIDASLERLDGHLASLRRTITKLDSAIPFFDFGDSAPVEPPPASAASADAAPPAGAEPQPAAAPAGQAPAPQPAAEPALARRDPLVGTWISQYPNPQNTAMLLLPDAKAFYLIRVSNQGAGKLPCTWSRTANTITLTFEPQTVKKPDGSAETVTRTDTYTIVSQTSRTLTLEDRGEIIVYARP